MPDLARKNKFTLGGSTPEEQIQASLVLNLLSGIVSFVLAMLLYWTFGWRNDNTHPLIYIVAAFLLAMCGWQFSTFAVGLKLKKNFKKRRDSGAPTDAGIEQSQLNEAKTQSLPEADFADLAKTPESVIEDTTRHLDKSPR